MATGRDVIERMMRTIGFLGVKETPLADDINDALSVINELVSSWNKEHLMLYRDEIIDGTWSADSQTQTFGPSGDITTTGERPDWIKGAGYVVSGQEIPITVLDDVQEYARIPNKTTSSSATRFLYYEPTITNGTIYLYPVPDNNLALKLYVWFKLSTGITLSADTALPDAAYTRALHYNGALELAMLFNMTLGPELSNRLERAARESKAVLKSLNIQPRRIGADPGALGGKRGRGYDISSDQLIA